MNLTLLLLLLLDGMGSVTTTDTATFPEIEGTPIHYVPLFGAGTQPTLDGVSTEYVLLKG
jgi:hypothetical protein